MRPIPFALAAILAACAPRGLAAAAQEVPARWGPYSVELVDESGRPLPTFEHRGRTYVLGALGERYLLRVRNGSGRRVEVVASVDGRDVVDGRPAAFAKRGYVLAPYGDVTIDGFRLSEASVAAFRFSSVPRSYAARMGNAREVGVVGVAIFPERRPAYLPPPYPYPGPYPSYGAPPADGRAGAGGAQEPSPKPSPKPSPEGGARAESTPPPPSASEAPLADRSKSAAPGSIAPPRRPGLGTEFGEEHASPIEQVSFVRAGSRPEAVLTLRYDDRPGLLALGIDVDGSRTARRDDRWLRETATPFPSEPAYCEPPRGWQR